MIPLKRRTIDPDSLLMPENLSRGFDEEKLRIYYKLARNHILGLFPVIITRHYIEQGALTTSLQERLEVLRERHQNNTLSARELEAAEQILPRWYEELERRAQGTTHYILDGNHRSMASVLAEKPVTAYDLKTDEQLEEVKRRVTTGEIVSFPHKEKTLSEIITKAEQRILGDHLNIPLGPILSKEQIEKRRIEGKGYPIANDDIRHTMTPRERVRLYVNRGHIIPEFMLTKFS